MCHYRYSLLVLNFILASFAEKTNSTKNVNIEHAHYEFDSAAGDGPEISMSIVKAKQQNRSGTIVPTLYQGKTSGNGKLRNKKVKKVWKTSVKQTNVNGKRSKRSEEISDEDMCQLQVRQNTMEAFHARVMYDKVDALHLNFKFAEEIKLSTVPGLILPYQWRWVYQETLSYLRMPYAAVVWSLGLLYIHNGEPLDVYF